MMAESKIKIETAPFDPRFPNTNQAKRCWVRKQNQNKNLKNKTNIYFTFLLLFLCSVQ